jgi:hypothetical protein
MNSMRLLNLHHLHAVFRCLSVFLIHLSCQDDPKFNQADQFNNQAMLQVDQSIDQSVLKVDQSTDQSVLKTDQSMILSTDQSIDAYQSGIEGVFEVLVTLDDQPVENAFVSQGGTGFTFKTNQQGKVLMWVDPSVAGQLMIVAAHPSARTKAVEVSDQQESSITIALTAYEASDESNYQIADPGEPTRRNSTAQCGHCHLTNNDSWFESPHRSSAKNPIVYDLFMGSASGYQTQEDCIQANGKWKDSRSPGTDERKFQCFFEISALKAYQPNCQENPCEDNLTHFGGCADCHAPAIDLKGQQNLLDARGIAYEYGISCDICHRVDQVRLDQPAGVAGRLLLSKPIERASPTLGAGGKLPLTFGPSADVPNPRMGVVQRDHYTNGELCAGCHFHEHLMPESRYHPQNETRWPNQNLPNQSTYQEWQTSPYGDIPCNECHMPAKGKVANSANLEAFPSADIGIQAGWPRANGDVREHAWWGPRQPKGKMLEQAAALSISKLDSPNHQLLIELETTNLGAGHFLPTGEPMRHLISVVEATCEGRILPMIGGDLVHDIAGYQAIKHLSSISNSDGSNLNEQSNPLIWPQAQIGDEIRIVRKLNDFYQYDGFGAFAIADGRFSIQEKGLQKEEAIGSYRIISKDQNNIIQTDPIMPAFTGLTQGESWTAYLINHPLQLAGKSGFSFARVMVSPTFNPELSMVPHFIATDIVRDNRLKPMTPWKTQHRFDLSTPCDGQIQVNAKLIYRPYPYWLAKERGWYMWDRLMMEVEDAF